MRRTAYIFASLTVCLQEVGSAPWFFRETKLWGVRPRRRNNVQEFDELRPARGGSTDNEGHERQVESDSEPPKVVDASSLSITGEEKKYCSALVLDLRRRSAMSGDHDESLDLRRLITTRCREYMESIREASEDGAEKKLPHPKKLLHFLAPKVPAIRQSPDVNLRIRSARSDMDSGLASCIISTVAQVCEVYDKERIHQAERDEDSTKPPLAAAEIIKDRRFEQLVECVLSGVNVMKRNREALKRELDANNEDEENIEELLDEEDLEESDGLSIRDACRAAWGIAILGGHHLETLGGEKTLDLLQALSLRTRELLLARLKLLRQDDLLSEPGLAHLTTEERMNELAEELAEDAASAMWAFACVKACTGLRSVPLFETCCSILCQDPVDLRRRAQEIDDENGSKNVGNNDVVDRLARSGAVEDEEDYFLNRNAANETSFINWTKDALLDWLSKTQINDVMWALALHGRDNTTSSNDDITLSETAATLGEIAFDRLIEALEEDLRGAKLEHSEFSQPVPEQFIQVSENENMTVEVVDAAALLVAQAQEASQIQAESANKVPLESMTVNSGRISDGAVQQVEVVDAASLLSAENEGDPVSFVTEIMITSSSHASESDDARNAGRIEERNESPPANGVGANTRQESTFSPHDLACIAWSVVELQDPLRMQVLPIVIRLVAMIGESATESLSGADLANLAWAVSKFEAEASSSEAHTPSSSSLSVISWIAHTTLHRVRSQKVSSSLQFESDILELLQPPELGRLLWAVACVMSTYAQVPDRLRQDGNIRALAEVALKTASVNLSLFGTEDLVRTSL